MVNYPIRERGRLAAHAIALAVVGIVAAVVTGLAPAAGAAAGGEAPLLGAGLSIDLDTALDLQAQGVTATGVNGATNANGKIELPVGTGSIAYRDRKITGGRVLLEGGIELSKGAKRITVSDVAADIETGVLTGKVGDASGVRLGAVNDPGSAEVEKPESSSVATLKLAEQGITLAAGFAAAVDKALGTNLSAEFPSDGLNVAADLNVDVDLAVGAKVNTDLIVALGLQDQIDVNLGRQSLLDAVVKIGTHF